MIRDPFYQSIIEALGRQLDPDCFERCATDLLRRIYPTLVPVPGGADAGMDGAIADGTESPFPLVCTTAEDVARNLRASLRSYKKQGGNRRKAVFATSREVTPPRRRKLEELATSEGFTLVGFYEQRAMANLLYRSPRWCRDLLNLTGDPPPLSHLPLTNRPLLDHPLVGREADLRWLRQQEGDLLLYGQPGCGKTYLLYRFVQENGGLFIVSDNIGAIAGAIRERQPAALIVDDAHTKCELLTELRRFRQEMGAGFRIIADCWPGKRHDVASVMGILSESVRELELLTRDEIVDVIKAGGIYGPTALVRELVDQSVGKPGLAITLCHLCLADAIRDVVLGDALARDVRRTFEPMEGRDATQVLAAFAVGGDAGMGMQVVADELRLSLPQVRHTVTSLAAGGIIREEVNRLAVWPPPLRYALVRDTFFSGPRSLPFNNLAAAAPDDAEVTLTLIGARARGAVFPDSLITDRLGCVSRDTIWLAYASLGQKESRWVLEQHPARLVAVAPLALQHVPELAIPMLLKRAVGDQRELNSHTDHPLRIIQDWIHSGRPDTPEAVGRRQALVTAAETWLREGKDVEMGLRAIEFAMSPNYQDTEANPGSGSKITLKSGFITRKQVTALHDLWSEAVASIRDVVVLCWMPLISAVEHVMCPHAMNAKLGVAAWREMRKLARRMVQDIAQLASERPGVLAWAQRAAKHLRLRLPLDVPEEYAILSPTDGLCSDWQRALEKHAKAAQMLGERWAREAPELIAQRLVYLEAEASAAGERAPRWSPHVCHHVALNTPAPLLWGNQLMNCGSRPELLDPFLARAIEMNCEGLAAIAARCLASQAYRVVGASLVLAMKEPPPDLLQHALGQLPDMVSIVETCCQRGGVSEQNLPHLLDHPDADVAVSAAAGLYHATQHNIPEAIKPMWRRAITRACKTQMNLHGVFDGDPDLGFEWLVNQIRDSLEQLRRNEYTLTQAIAALTPDHRCRLLDEIGDEYPTKTLIEQLVGDDLTVFRHLLSRSNLSCVHLVLLQDSGGALHPDKAVVALDAGYTPEKIADAIRYQEGFWMGPASEHWQDRINRFQPLLKHPDLRLRFIATEFIKWAEARREHARREERIEAVYGRD